jgi:hypothetical protein
VGHDGKDITPKELRERYLNNPEVCFKEPPKEEPQEQGPTGGDNTPDNTDISKNSILPPLVWSNNLTEFRNDTIEQSSTMKQPSKIYNSGIRLGSQLILFKDPLDFFLSKIHPGIMDNSLKIEFVTSKTETRPTVRFLKRQTPEHRYYYSCLHRYDVSKATFGSIDEYERHIVMGHKPGTVGYPGGADIEKIEVDRVRRKQGESSI